MKRAAIFGACSAIAVATARMLAEQGYTLLLAARAEERLQVLAQDLRSRGAADCELLSYDAESTPLDQQLADTVWASGLDFMLVAHGQLPDQAAVQDDPEATARELNVNAGSAIGLLALFAGRFESQGNGTVAVISSVAGDRGRQSNYVYGSAKAAVSTYTQGLRNRLSKSGVCVLTIKPGFVDSPMTAHLEKGFLWAQPDKVAADILGARQGSSGVVYTPWFWRYIMLIIKLIPERLFKKLSL